jgi:hypothetical protein
LASPDKKAFLLRLPPEVWAQLERLAAAELRSVNGQIEYLLREALARRMTPPGAPEQGGGAHGSGTSQAAPGSAPAGSSRRPQRHRK